MAVTLYWNNVCLLSKQEERHLADARAILAADGIDLAYEVFGLGRPGELVDRVRETRGGFDILVSTEPLVYEEPDVCALYAQDLVPADRLPPPKDFMAAARASLPRGAAAPMLLPVLVIPLVMVVHRKAWGDRPLPGGFADIEHEPKAYGGRDNAAGANLRRQLAARFGEGYLGHFERSATAYEMPVEAFQAVRKGAVPVAVVPTIFAERADGEALALVYPAEGAAFVPSCAVVKNTLGDAVRGRVLDALFPARLMRFYAANAIEPCLAGAEDAALVAAHGHALL